jgi:hypothetical protein
MANNLIYNAKIQGFSGTLVQIANTTGAITVDCSAGHYQTIAMAGNISVSFTTATWPAAGSVGIIRLQITVDTANRTLTLPANVSLGTTGIQGYSANVITFAAAGVYEFGFLTYDQGTTITLFDYNRPLSYYTNAVNIAATTASTSNVTGALTVAGGVGIGGNLYVTGDIVGNVTLTDINVGTVTATGNVQGGNLRTTGLISATGNITGGNVLGGANVNATLHTGTTVSVTGNITGGNVLSPGMIKSSSSTAGIGYATGAGTTVTQTVSRTQGVQIDRVTGQITLVSAAGTSSYNTFIVTNSTVQSGDVIILSQKGGTDKYNAFVTNVTNGTFSITFNDVSGTTTEQPVFNFAVIKAVAA